jgi:2-polyprenyl-3-methyl-5-hydroxy-6-metoxy-1,4-benzoquinol methylase
MASDTQTTPYGDYSRVEMLAFVPATVKRMLDVGCHMGNFGRQVKEAYGAEVWGIEPNPHTAAVAEKVLDKVQIGFFGEDSVLPAAYFDVICFNDVLEHMPDPWSALRLASRLLAPGGCVVASIPNLRHIDNLMHILRERDFNYEPYGIRDRTHLRFYTRKSVPRLFEDSGMTITKMAGINECWWSPSITRRLAYRCFPKYLDDTRHIQFAVVATPTVVTPP